MNIDNLKKFQFTRREVKLGLYLYHELDEVEIKNITKQIDFLLQMRWIDSVYYFYSDFKTEYDKELLKKNFDSVIKLSDYKRSFFIYSATEDAYDDFRRALHDYMLFDYRYMNKNDDMLARMFSDDLRIPCIPAMPTDTIVERFLVEMRK